MHVARLLLLVLLAIPAGAPATPLPDQVILGPDAPTYQPLNSGQLSVLRDPRGTLALADVRAADAAGQFTILPRNLGAGYTRDVYWLRFHAWRDARDDRRWWWLEMLPPFLDDVQLYIVHPDGTVESKRAGDRRPRASRDLDHRAILFRLDLPPGANTAYLRISTTSAMVAVINVWRSQELMQSSFTQYLLYGLYIGLVLAIFILIAINWLLLRDRLFLLYLAYIGAQILYGLASSGLAGQYLFPDTPRIPDVLVGLSLALTALFGLAFFSRILDVPGGSRWLPWLYRLTALAAVVTAVGALADYYVVVIPWLQALILLTVAATLPLAALRVLHGTPTQRLAGLAFFAYGVLVLASSATFIGLLPTTRASMFSAQAGNLAHLFLLHAAMAMRSRTSAAEREQLERQAAAARIAAEQERRRSDEHDQLLAMITHEIRTPIAVIDAAAQSLHLVDDKAPAERTTRYERIQRSVRRLNLLLELALNRVRPADTHGEPARACDLIELGHDVVGQFEPQHDQQLNVWMAVDAAPVHGRADLLRFVFLNLLDNACKYSPPGSMVNIEVTAMERDGRAGYAWTISDEGPGIAAGERERIFDKFYRGNEGTATAGLGLGLYISSRIVGQVGGNLRCIEPLPGQGARFECWLPAA